MMDIMGITSFGVDPSHIKSVDEGGKENTFLDCFDRILSPPTKLGRALMFAHGYVSTRWFPCEANRDFNSACEWMREELGKMVADRRRAISSGMTSGEYDRSESDAADDMGRRLVLLNMSQKTPEISCRLCSRRACPAALRKA